MTQSVIKITSYYLLKTVKRMTQTYFLVSWHLIYFRQYGCSVDENNDAPYFNMDISQGWQERLCEKLTFKPDGYFIFMPQRIGIQIWYLHQTSQLFVLIV